MPVIVPAPRFLADAEELIAPRGADRRAVAEQPPGGRACALARALALIALVFPKFRDGRAYSQARLLREHYGFRGELRATGDVLRDQFHVPGARRL